MMPGETGPATSVNSAGVAPKARRPAERGSAIVETAFVLPLLLLLSIGIVQIGLLMSAYNSVNALARMGARWAMVHGEASTSPATETDVRNFIMQNSKGLDHNNLTVTATWNPNTQAGATVTVRLQYNFPLSIPLLSSRSITIAGTARAVITH